MSRHSSGFVYFIQAPLNGLIKIGSSNSHPDRRLAILRTMSPIPLKRAGYIFCESDAHAREFELHRQFHYLREHGEWFHPGPSLLNFIEQSTTKWRTPHSEIRPPVRRKLDADHKEKRRLDEETALLILGRGGKLRINR